MTILPAAKVTNLVGIVLVTCLASLSVHINAFPADTENELSPYMSGESANELGDSLLHQLDDYLPHQPLNDFQKRFNSKSFFIARGKKSSHAVNPDSLFLAPDLDYEPLDSLKRAAPSGFFMPRGKKAAYFKGHGKNFLRGKKAPNSSSFYLVRGKKAFDEPEGDLAESTPNSASDKQELLDLIKYFNNMKKNGSSKSK